MKRVRNLIFAALLAAAALPAAEESQKAEPDRTPWEVANFVLLVAGLGYVIYKTGGPFFAARSQSIRKGLEDAARATKEAEARCAEVEQRLANLGAEIEKLKAQAHQESAAEAERMRAESKRAIEKLREQTEQEIGAAAKGARQELRTYAAGLAVGLAENRIRERMTPDSEKALLGAMLEDLERRSDAQAARTN